MFPSAPSLRVAIPSVPVYSSIHIKFAIYWHIPSLCHRSYRTMETSIAKRPRREHVLWALNKQKGEEHVTLPNFVHKFNFRNQDSAYSAFSVLIENSQIESRRSERLQEAFKEFRENSEAVFWSELESMVDTLLSSRKSGIIARAAGLRQAAQDYDSHFGDIGWTKRK